MRLRHGWFWLLTTPAHFQIDLNISSAVEADTGDHYYLRGELNAALPAGPALRAQSS